jgi:hypothetical protein
MSEITYNYNEIVANVQDYRGYTNFIMSITIGTSATDGVNTVTTRGVYELDVDRVFTEEEPFVPFDQWDQQKVLSVVNFLIERAQTKERLQRKLKVKAAQPQPKNFNI